MAHPVDDLYSKSMSDEKVRLLFITDPELPTWKLVVKEEADKQGTSSTELMVRTLCEHYGLEPPPRERRPARDVVESKTLALSIPVKLWQKIHAESGKKLTSKKEIVLSILGERFAFERGKA